eukprot:81433_1
MSITWPVSLCHDKDCEWHSHFSQQPLGKGIGKTVYYGRYCQGSKWQNNRKCVVKFYNHNYVFEQDFWSREIQAHEKANELAYQWSKSKRKTNIKVLVPEQIQSVIKNGTHERKNDEYTLTEPYLSEFVKFNSNTTVCPGYEYSEIQAFSHWTYHYSNGKYLFCDCQGMENKNGFTLTDPVIVSKDSSFWSASYGPCDGGKDMMITWFQNHKCNEYCGSNWKRAYGIKHTYIKPTAHTSYVWDISNYQKNQYGPSRSMGTIHEMSSDKLFEIPIL